MKAKIKMKIMKMLSKRSQFKIQRLKLKVIRKTRSQKTKSIKLTIDLIRLSKKKIKMFLPTKTQKTKKIKLTKTKKKIKKKARGKPIKILPQRVKLMLRKKRVR